MNIDAATQLEYYKRHVAKMPKKFHSVRITTIVSCTQQDVIEKITRSGTGQFSINRLTSKEYRIGFKYPTELTSFLITMMDVIHKG